MPVRYYQFEVDRVPSIEALFLPIFSTFDEPNHPLKRISLVLIEVIPDSWRHLKPWLIESLLFLTVTKLFGSSCWSQSVTLLKADDALKKCRSFNTSQVYLTIIPRVRIGYEMVNSQLGA